MTTEPTVDMAVELSDMAAIELSEDELDTVAGGFSLNLGDFNSLASSSSSDFFQRNLSLGQGTFAGPNGSGTLSMMNLQEIASSASQSLVIS